MALYPCPECGRDVSTDAKNCPGCGKDLRFAGAGARWAAVPKPVQALLLFAICFGVAAMLLGRGKADAPPQSLAQAQPATAIAASPGKSTLTVQPGDWIGYQSKELMDQAVKFAARGDRDAYTKLMGNGVSKGLATMLKAGEEVYLEDTALMAGAVKIRRKGETSSWWTNYEAVK